MRNVRANSFGAIASCSIAILFGHFHTINCERAVCILLPIRFESAGFVASPKVPQVSQHAKHFLPHSPNLAKHSKPKPQKKKEEKNDSKRVSTFIQKYFDFLHFRLSTVMPFDKVPVQCARCVLIVAFNFRLYCFCFFFLFFFSSSLSVLLFDFLSACDVNMVWFLFVLNA